MVGEASKIPLDLISSGPVSVYYMLLMCALDESEGPSERDGGSRGLRLCWTVNAAAHQVRRKSDVFKLIVLI